MSRRAERAVDSLQKTYAVIIGLAIGSAIEQLLHDPATGTLRSISSVIPGLPVFVALLFTVVPFFHGMNRHLDKQYLEKKKNIRQGAVLLDVAVFLVEASLLFAVTWSLRSLEGFFYLGGVLLLDVMWGLVSHLIHHEKGADSTLRNWATINIVVVVVALFVALYPSAQRPLLLMILAIGRTVADYRICWRFYFPLAEG